MELLTNNINLQDTIFLILFGFMPFLSICTGFIVVFNLKHIDNRTALICLVMSIFMIIPAITILTTLI